MARTHYSDEQKAEALAALAANDGNVSKTAQQLGIGRTTLQQWKTRGVPEVVTQLSHEKSGDLADRMEALAHALLGDLEDPARRIGKVNEVTTSIGIAIDKARLLRGESTSISEQRQDRRTLYARITPDSRASGAQA